MKGKVVLLLFLLLMASDISNAHRLMMGYRVNELQIKAIYDDGTPAQGIEVEVFSDGKRVAGGTTDENGDFKFQPREDLGEITFISSSAGHRAELSLNIAQKKPAEELSLPFRAAAGLGYLLGIAGLAMIYLSKKGGRSA